MSSLFNFKELGLIECEDSVDMLEKVQTHLGNSWGVRLWG